MHVPERFRVIDGPMKSNESFGNNGAFIVKLNPRKHQRQHPRVIASDEGGWEHVSVSFKYRTPTWEEMCAIKDLFWDGDDCVVQYHPPEDAYVNNHPYCLHLWKPRGVPMPMPPEWMVGLKELNP